MMPSRYSHVATFPMAPLSGIIKLEPEEEPWCAGYAPSQGRRCHMRTNARGRRSAMMLLNEGTKDLQAGRNIDILLEDLAPHVLCTRFHQNQASDLVRRWKRKVRKYLDSQIVSTPYTRPARRSPRMISETAAAEMEERIAVLQQRLREAKEKIRRLEAAQYVLPTITNTTITNTRHREGRNTSTVVNSSSRGSASTRNTPVHHVNEPLRRASTESSTNQLAITVSWLAQAQASPQTSAISVSSPRPVNTPTVARASSRIGNTTSQDETPQSIRREVEGECGICLCDLHGSQDGDLDEEEDSESSGDDDHDDEDDYDDYDDSDSDNYDYDDNDYDVEDNDADDHEHLNELVWCKARCGVNFHKQCIDQWLETDHASKCPTCRSNWKH